MLKSKRKYPEGIMNESFAESAELYESWIRLAREQAERERAERQAAEIYEFLPQEAVERERLAREAARRAEEERAEEERERLELEDLQEQCKEIEVLEKLVNRRKRVVSSCLDSLSPVQRARIAVE